MSQPESFEAAPILKVDHNLFVGNIPSFQRPKIIGYYTIDSGRTFSRSLSGLKYVHLPRYRNVKFDLNHGFENAIKKDENTSESDEFIPRWLTEQENARDKRLQADFIGYRGLLTMLMCTPYEKQENWIICATQVQGTIYLCVKETDEKKLMREQMTEKEKRFTSWGYKFEQYMTSDKPDSYPNITEPVNEADEFCVMFKSRLNEHTLIYAAEVDGIESEKEVLELEGTNIIELKTNRHISSERQDWNFRRYKCLKWWAQSFLVGINKIICGFRNNQGMVENLHCFKVAELPNLGHGMWDPNVCMNFCDQFLTFVKGLVQKETSPHVVWKFEWKPGQNVTSERFENPADLKFLPDWFISKLCNCDHSSEGEVK